VEWVVVEQVFYRCSICGSFPEIFAIKLESSQKSRRNLDVFGHPKFYGADLPKNGTHILTPPFAARGLEKFREGTPTNREVTGAHTLNSRQNFKFVQIFFGWGGAVPVVVCAM